MSSASPGGLEYSWGQATAEGTAGNWRCSRSVSWLRVLIDNNIVTSLVPFCDGAAALVDGGSDFYHPPGLGKV